MEKLPEFPQIEGVRFAHIPGWHGYAASDDGRIWSCKKEHSCWKMETEWRVKKPRSQQVSCATVKLKHRGMVKQSSVGSFVLLAFMPPPKKGRICVHKPGTDITDSRLANIKWGTKRDLTYKKQHYGQNHHSSKLKNRDVLKIYRLRKKGVFICDIALAVNISETCVFQVVHGLTWKHLYHHFTGESK